MTLAVFMVVNLALLPIAFVKTVVHKAVLLKKYGGGWHLRNLLIFLFFGVPLLAVTQLTDVYFFMQHTFSNK